MKAVQFVGLAVLTGALALSVSGCVSAQGRKVVPHSHANQLFKVEMGTVLSVREIVIEGSADTNVGLYGGGIMGGTTGSMVGSGRGSAIAGAAGAVGGMIVGREIEKAVTRKEGLEITIQLDDGKQVVIVQPKDQGGFMDGDRVRVTTGENSASVSH